MSMTVKSNETGRRREMDKQKQWQKQMETPLLFVFYIVIFVATVHYGQL